MQLRRPPPNPKACPYVQNLNMPLVRFPRPPVSPPLPPVGYPHHLWHPFGAQAQSAGMKPLPGESLRPSSQTGGPGRGSANEKGPHVSHVCVFPSPMGAREEEGAQIRITSPAMAGQKGIGDLKLFQKIGQGWFRPMVMRGKPSHPVVAFPN